MRLIPYAAAIIAINTETKPGIKIDTAKLRSSPKAYPDISLIVLPKN